jgi:hypothetical protein
MNIFGVDGGDIIRLNDSNAVVACFLAGVLL